MTRTTPTKALVTLLTGLGGWLAIAPTDGVTGQEWGTLAGVGVAAVLVWLVPNQPLEKRDGEAGQVQFPGFVWVLLVIALLLAILWLVGHPVHVA